MAGIHSCGASLAPSRYGAVPPIPPPIPHGATSPACDTSQQEREDTMRKTASPTSLSIALALAATFSTSLAFAADPKAGDMPETGNAAQTQLSWSELDADKDGNLSATEADASPALKAHFSKADANADGTLTSDEYREYLAKAGTGMGEDADKQPRS